MTVVNKANAPAALYPWLVADVGGTNARFGWVSGPGELVAHVQVLSVAAYADIASAAQAYLSALSGELGGRYQAPRRAAFALATAIVGDRIELTNSHWSFSRLAVQAALQLDALLLLNDFEALALSLPRLRSSQLRVQGAAPSGQGTLAVIGPGTGLGVGAVVQTPQGWVALPGEGGHATLAALDDYEAALLSHVRRRHAHVSAERVLSGIGLPTLHAAVCDLAGRPLSEPFSAAQIVERGLTGEDALASETLDAFCALLGSFAGNVALTLGARGGVFIGGGIVPRLGERFFTSRFRERFEAKGRFDRYLAQVPTALIIDTLAALTGSALAIEQDAQRG
jgi:glucokinase